MEVVRKPLLDGLVSLCLLRAHVEVEGLPEFVGLSRPRRGVLAPRFTVFSILASLLWCGAPQGAQCQSVGLRGEASLAGIWSDVGEANGQYLARYLPEISFGSASLSRPLMWFDRVDPLDPLQLTEGVWAVLGRAHLPGNITAWGWVLLVTIRQEPSLKRGG